MSKLTLISLLLLGLGLALWLGYAVQGSYVDEDGVLQESFHLLALGWVFTFAGAVDLMGSHVSKFMKQRTTSE